MVKSGLLLTDITDHLPVFAVFKHKLKMNKVCDYKLQRVRMLEAIEAFKAELDNHDWKEVYVEETNDSYNAFLDIFMSLYDCHCPVRKIKVKPKSRENLWITKGLEKACKKKDQLYKDFIKHRTKEKEY